jgi:AcrR family transcriptional regulator
MRQKKPHKRKVQGAETKKRLYDIAAKLFLEHSFAEVNVEDITDEAGITKGAFYVHFASKDALIAMIIADYAARADTDYKSFMDTLPADMPAPDMLLALTEKITDVMQYVFGCENMKKAYQMLLTKAIDDEVVTGYDREVYTLFRSIIEKGIRQGQLRSTMSVEELACHFVTALRGFIYEWCIRYPDFDLKKQAVEHCRLLIEGIAI